MTADTESWKRMVLRSMPSPAWLASGAPEGDVVLSSRVRFMRNLRGFRFTHKADADELRRIMQTVLEAAKHPKLDLEALKGITNAERDYLVGCRLVSPDFAWTEIGRALLIDEQRQIGVMINEEDHLRIQALTAGYSPLDAEKLAKRTLEQLGETLEFAHSPKMGFSAASATNLGPGRRISVMFHLIGLANAKRLPAVMNALAERGIVVRGLFGESSRAIGAFAQISTLRGSAEEFTGACDYLLSEERAARGEVSNDELHAKASQARLVLDQSVSLGLADALRILAWMRWASYSGLEGFEFPNRAIDSALTSLEMRGTLEEGFAAGQRVVQLRALLKI